MESTISSISMPARDASPFGSSAATIGVTASSRPHISRSKPSSSRTKRMPSRSSSVALLMRTSRSAREGCHVCCGLWSGVTISADFLSALDERLRKS
jgi:hypothetical protein